MQEINRALQNLSKALFYKDCATLLHLIQKKRYKEDYKQLTDVILMILKGLYTDCIIVGQRVVDIEYCESKYILLDIEEEVVFWKRYVNKLNGIPNGQYETMVRKERSIK